MTIASDSVDVRDPVPRVEEEAAKRKAEKLAKRLNRMEASFRRHSSRAGWSPTLRLEGSRKDFMPSLDSSLIECSFADATEKPHRLRLLIAS